VHSSQHADAQFGRVQYSTALNGIMEVQQFSTFFLFFFFFFLLKQDGGEEIRRARMAAGPPTADVLIVESGYWTGAQCRFPELALASYLPRFLFAVRAKWGREQRVGRR